MDIAGYTGAEVAARFGLSSEAVRLAGERGDLNRVNAKPGGGRPAWRYPRADIDALDVWPAARRGPRPHSDDETDRIRQEVAALRLELGQERVGRGVAEKHIVELEAEIFRLRSALLVFIDPDGALRHATD